MTYPTKIADYESLARAPGATDAMFRAWFRARTDLQVYNGLHPDLPVTGNELRKLKESCRELAAAFFPDQHLKAAAALILGEGLNE